MKTSVDLNRLLKLLALLEKEEQQTQKHKKSQPRKCPDMTSRVNMAAVVEAYHKLSPVIQDFFPLRPKGKHLYNLFMKHNLGKVNIYLTKTEASYGACPPAPFHISHGTLPSIETVRSEEGAVVTSLCVPSGFCITESTTLGEVSDALLSANVGLDRNDELTVVRPVQVEKRLPRPELHIPTISITTYRFALNRSSQTPFYTLVPASLFRSVNDRIQTDNELEEGAVAYVHTRVEGSKTLVSTQQLVLTGDNATYRLYSSSDKRREAALSYENREPTLYELGAELPVCNVESPESAEPAPEPVRPQPVQTESFAGYTIKPTTPVPVRKERKKATVYSYTITRIITFAAPDYS